MKNIRECHVPTSNSYLYSIILCCYIRRTLKISSNSLIYTLVLFELSEDQVGVYFKITDFVINQLGNGIKSSQMKGSRDRLMNKQVTINSFMYRIHYLLLQINVYFYSMCQDDTGERFFYKLQSPISRYMLEEYLEYNSISLFIYIYICEILLCNLL